MPTYVTLMFDQSAYTRKQWVTAVNLSAMLGWAGVAGPMALQSNFGILLWAAILGLPIAFMACWMLGAPILRRIMHKSITWFAAACWGGLIALIISLAGSVVGRLYGLWTYLDPTSHYQIGGGEYIQEIDGILTAYGWLILAKSTAMFVLMGVPIALIVRWIIGPGAPTKQDDQQ